MKSSGYGSRRKSFFTAATTIDLDSADDERADLGSCGGCAAAARFGMLFLGKILRFVAGFLSAGNHVLWEDEA